MNKKLISAILIIVFLGAGVFSNFIGEISTGSAKELETVHFNDVQLPVERSGSEDDDWWTMFHHDKEHTGHSSSQAPRTSNVRWTQQIPYTIDISSPAIVNDKVYIGTSDTFWKKDWVFERSIDVFDFLEEQKQSGYYYGLYCYNASTGSPLWEYPTSSMVDSSPAVYNDKVYFVSSDFEFSVATLYCVNALNGSELWHDSIDNFSFCSPTVAEGFVYVLSLNGSTNSGNVYCYNAEAGNREWTFPLPPHEYPPLMNPTVTFCSGFVYFIGLNETTYEGTLYCVNAVNGTEQWRFPLGYISDTFAVSPVCSNGLVFACGMTPSERDQIFALDAQTGDFQWVYPVPPGSYVLSTPACDGEQLYFVALNEEYFSTIVYCIEIEHGTLRWQRILGNYEIILCSPAVAEGKLYFGSWMYGFVYCLDTTNSHTIWLYQTNYDMITSSPAIANHRLYIATCYGLLYAFEDEPKEDLECEGSLQWTDVKPRATVTGSFTVENKGDPGTELDWKIESYPEWGTWTCTPSSGVGLTPEAGKVTIEVSVIAPNTRNEEFTGQIKVANSEDPTDLDVIEVSLATPYEYLPHASLLHLFEQILERFPLLGWIMGYSWRVT